MRAMCWRCRGMRLVPAPRPHNDGYHLMLPCELCRGTGMYPPPEDQED